MDFLPFLPPIIFGLTFLALILGSIWTLVRRRVDTSVLEAELAQSEFGRRLLEVRREEAGEHAREKQTETDPKGDISGEREQRLQKLKQVLEELGCRDILERLRRAQRLLGGKYRLGPKMIEARSLPQAQAGLSLGWAYYTRDFERYHEVYDLGVWAREEGWQTCVWVGPGPTPSTAAPEHSVLYTDAHRDALRKWIEDRLIEIVRNQD